MPRRGQHTRRHTPRTPVLDLRRNPHDSEEEDDEAPASTVASSGYESSDVSSESESDVSSESESNDESRHQSRSQAKKRRTHKSRRTPAKKRRKRSSTRSTRDRSRSPRRRSRSPRRRSRSPRHRSRSPRRSRTSKRRSKSSLHRSSRRTQLFSSSESSDNGNTSSHGMETYTGDGIIARGDGVDVPPVDRTEFESWSDIEAYLAAYWRRTYQVFKARGWTATKLRNERMEQTTSDQKIPERFQFYCKSYVCTHSGKPRKARGSDRDQCSILARLSVQLRFQLVTGVWEVVLTKQIRHHNHAVSAEIFSSYHESRKVVDEDVLDTVRTLDRAGANRKRILEFIADNSAVEPDMKDIHNLVAKLRKEEYKFPTIEERIRAILEDFASKKGNVARVFANDEGVVECISIQSSHMRKMFDHFPEILLIDATHDTNDCNYKLFSFMIHDAMGKGQHVQHCLLENERKPTLRVACRQFKDACPSWRSLEVVMIDKDFTEMAVLEEEFPGVRVLLCQFHVVKYLQEEVSKVKYNLSSWSKKQMKQLFSLLVSAPTEKIYDGVITTMELSVKPDESRTIWWEYFNKNWAGCKERWSSVYRGNVPHMGNTTTNRLESSWQKLKTLVNKSTALDDCVVAILFWQTVNERKWARAVNKIGVFMNSDFDDEMNALLNSVSRYAVDLIKQQYDFALKDSTSYERYPMGPFQVMKYSTTDGSDDHDENMVKPSDWSCSCIFQTTRLLPCRHIIYYRKVTGCSTLVPVEIIHPRWLVNNYKQLRSEECEPVDVPYEDKTVPHDAARTAKSQNDKFNELLSFGRQIADVGSSWGTTAQTGLCRFLRGVLDEVRNGRVPGFQGGIGEDADAEEPLQVEDPDEVDAQSGSQNEEGAQSQEVLHSNAVERTTEATTHMEIQPPPRDPSDVDDGQSETEAQYETEPQSQTDPLVHTDPVVDCDEEEKISEDAEPEEPASPQWTIAASKKRSGLTKSRKKARKEAKSDSLKQTAKFVRGVAQGTVPSMEVVMKAYESGWTYRDAQVLCALPETIHKRNSAIVVAELSKQPRTDPSRVHSVLPRERVEACETQIAVYQNRYRSDFDTTIPMKNLTAKSGSYVFDVEMLKAAKTWHVATPKFPAVHKTLKWIAALNLEECDSLGSDWTEACLEKKEMVKRLMEMNVLSDGYSLTTLRGEQWVDSSALDICIKGMIAKWQNEHAVFSCPAWLFKYPNADLTVINNYGVWKQLELAAADFGFTERLREDGVEVVETRENLWFFAAVHYDSAAGEHWCGIAVNYEDHAITIYDPMHTKDRFEALRTFMYEVLVPLLPKITKRWHFKQYDMTPQLDTFNCGPFLLLFFEIQLSGYRVQGGDPDTDEKVMQFMRYRYLSLGLSVL